MTMYSDKSQWYMSPPALIEQMLEPYVEELDYGSRKGFKYLRLGKEPIILEPSAGNGAICDYIVDNFQFQKKQFRVIESDPELQSILLSKGYRVVDTDFLDFDNVGFQYNYVFMNPPFNEGAKHLLKAWDMLDAGEIVCVLNAETLRKLHTADRQRLMQIILDYKGKIEDAGQPFKGSDQRATSVECSIVRLKKVAKAQEADFTFSEFDRDQAEGDPEFHANPLANPSLIKSLVAQHDGARRAIIAEAKVRAEYDFYMKGIAGYVPDAEAESYKEQDSLNARLESLRQTFWKHVFNATNIAEVVTAGYQKKFEQQFDRTRDLSFSEANIKALLQMFVLNIEEIMIDCVEEMFDMATEFHDKNKQTDKRWKTNKAYRANRKIILPSGIKHDSSYDFSRWSMASYDTTTRRYYRDIDRVMCHLSGIRIESIPQSQTLEGAIDAWQSALNQNYRGEYATVGGEQLAYSSWRESAFFRFRFYKSGTTHIEAKDPELWAKFNKAAFARKKWVMQDDYE